jgi:hypothetical protein
MKNAYIEYIKELIKDAGLKNKYRVRFGVVTSGEFEQRFINVYYITQVERESFLGIPYTTQKPLAVIGNLPLSGFLSRLELIRLYPVKKTRVKSDRFIIVPNRVNFQPPPQYNIQITDDLAELTTALGNKSFGNLEILLKEPENMGPRLEGLSERLGFADVVGRKN